jgi:hypothetical protein
VLAVASLAGRTGKNRYLFVDSKRLARLPNVTDRCRVSPPRAGRKTSLGQNEGRISTDNCEQVDRRLAGATVEEVRARLMGDDRVRGARQANSGFRARRRCRRSRRYNRI